MLTQTLLVLALATGQESGSNLFQALDGNNDGVVTAAEVNEKQRSHFRRALRIADQNGDGALTRLELQRALQDREPASIPRARGGAGNRPGMAANFRPEQFDRNKDGLLSPGEIPAPLRERYQQALDQFGQPALPVNLLQQYLRDGGTGNSTSKRPDQKPAAADDAAMKRTGRDSQPDIQSAQRRRMNAGGNGPGVSTIFSRLDRNSDGVLRGAEIPQRMRQNLQRIDGNSDGAISRSELEQVMRAMGRGRAEP